MDGVFIKYGELEHLQQIINGSLRFSPSQVYVKMEEKQHNKGQGDMLEGKWLLHVDGFRAEDPVTGRTMNFKGKANIVVNIQDVNSMPVFCLSYYDKECLSKDGNSILFNLPERKLDKIKTVFPKATHALIICNPDCFINGVNKIEGRKVVSDRIHYFNFDINEIGMAAFLTTGDEKAKMSGGMAYAATYDDRYRHLLCKDNAFKEQDEYRFIVLDELIDNPKKYGFDFDCPYVIVALDELKDAVRLPEDYETDPDCPPLTDNQISYIREQQSKANEAVSNPSSPFFEPDESKRLTAARALMRKWERSR